MTKKKFKIICITQMYNELEKGNLERFVKYVLPICDELVVYDDGSTDGSYEYIRNVTSHIIRRGKNDFINERSHKQLLLEKAKEIGADFIFYLDVDEVLSADAKEKMQKLSRFCINKNIDGIQFHKVNLWRSKTWKRVDSLFDIGWFVHFWRVTPQTKYTHIKKGLHQSPYPSTVKKIQKSDDIVVLHYGFADEKNIAYKYLTYKSYGQKGYTLLDRLLSEEKLEVKKVPEKIFPRELYLSNETKPENMPFINSLQYLETYKEQIQRPRYSIICLIYKNIEWLKFVYKQVLTYTDMTDKEFYFVANNATPEVLTYLKQNYIPHYIWNNSPDQRSEWYINNVYRAYNAGAKKAKGDFLILINSDMAFSEQWVENLMKAYTGFNCLCSRLVESGKMKSGLYGLDKNFGRSVKTFNESAFHHYSELIKEHIVKDSGLYGPLFIKKEHFLSVGGYPEGNVIPNSNIFKPKISKQGEICIPGDVILMEKLKMKGIVHQTVFDSIVYHFQEGEKDDSKTKKMLHAEKKILIANKKIFQLLKDMPGAIYLEDYLSLDTLVTHKGQAVIIQDVSEKNILYPEIYTIMYVAKEQEFSDYTNILKGVRQLITNSFEVMSEYRDYTFEYLPKNKQQQILFWQKRIEQAFQDMVISEIRKKKQQAIPKKEKIKLFLLQCSERALDTTKRIANEPIMLLKRLKHLIYQKFFIDSV